MNAALVDFAQDTASLEAQLSTCRSTKQAQENATWAHYKAAMAFRESKAWDVKYPNWTTCVADNCAGNKSGNPVSLFSLSYYRTLTSSLSIALASEMLTGEMMLPTQAKNLLGKMNEIIPEDEREAPLMLSMLALCYAAYPDKVVPDRNVLDEAYEILKEERDLGAISYDGKTYSLKEAAQVARLRERVGQDIAARSTRSTIEIAETRHLGLILRLARRLGYSVPNENKKLFISWKD